MNDNDTARYCSVRDAAKMLGLKHSTVLTYARNDLSWCAPQVRGMILPGCKLGELLFLSLNAVEKEAEKRKRR